MQEKKLIEDMNRPWGGYKVFTDNEKCTTKDSGISQKQVVRGRKNFSI